MTVVTEKVFKLTTDQQINAVEAERHGICGLQMSTTKKRPASDLIVETPAKVKAGKWSDAWQLDCKTTAVDYHVGNWQSSPFFSSIACKATRSVCLSFTSEHSRTV